jgi:hypothetical protein
MASVTGLFCPPGGGSSRIFAPDGRKLSEYILETEKGLTGPVVVEILRPKGFLDFMVIIVDPMCRGWARLHSHPGDDIVVGEEEALRYK